MEDKKTKASAGAEEKEKKTKDGSEVNADENQASATGKETAEASDKEQGKVDTSGETAQTEDKLAGELAAKEKELAQLNDKYLRMAAEYDNFRRRSAKEREGIYADAVSDVVLALLPVLDNLERASKFGADTANVAKGVEMTIKTFGDALHKLGVKEIDAQGKTFDPNLHNAVMHVEDETHGEGEIMEVLQKGFIKGDKVIRYAMVTVAN